MHGYESVSKIPKKLQGDDVSAARAAWLAGHVPDDKWEDVEILFANRPIDHDDSLPAPRPRKNRKCDRSIPENVVTL